MARGRRGRREEKEEEKENKEEEGVESELGERGMQAERTMVMVKVRGGFVRFELAWGGRWCSIKERRHNQVLKGKSPLGVLALAAATVTVNPWGTGGVSFGLNGMYEVLVFVKMAELMR